MKVDPALIKRMINHESGKRNVYIPSQTAEGLEVLVDVMCVVFNDALSAAIDSLRSSQAPAATPPSAPLSDAELKAKKVLPR